MDYTTAEETAAGKAKQGFIQDLNLGGGGEMRVCLVNF